MCLGIPGKILSISDDGTQALLDTMGLKSTAGLESLDEARPGEYVMIHAGQAIQKIDLHEAQERIKLWEEILKVGDTATLS